MQWCSAVQSPDVLSVISLCFFPRPINISFKTTIMTFCLESSFCSVHIIKVRKIPSPLFHSLSLSFHFLAGGFCNSWGLLLIHALTEQLHLTERSLLLLCGPFSPREQWEVMHPLYCLILCLVHQQEAPHLPSQGCKRPAASVSTTTVSSHWVCQPPFVPHQGCVTSSCKGRKICYVVYSFIVTAWMQNYS